MIDFKRKSVTLTAKEQEIIYEAVGIVAEESLMDFDLTKKEIKERNRRIDIINGICSKLVHG